MNYLTYGDQQNKAILFIHGMASTALLCFEPLLKYFKNYYVVLVEIDGHISATNEELLDVKDSCKDIENYINNNLGGHLYGLCGFSMGATMAVEIISKGNIVADRVVLDAPFIVKMGIKRKPLEFGFSRGIKRIQQGKKIPKFLMNFSMGKDNNSVVEMLYKNASTTTIINACEFLYTYDIPTGLDKYRNPVLFLRGSSESVPKKGAKLLKKYLPHLEEKVFNGMGHGQYLHEHPYEYANELLHFFN